MRDLVYILLTIGFFALAYASISGCARVLGPDLITDGSSADDATDDRGADTSRPAR